MKRSHCLLSFLILLMLAPAWGGSIVIGTEDSWNAFPFGGQTGGPGTRYQQAYAASNFAGLGSISITGIEFYDGILNFAPSTYSLYLSTITAGIDTLSNTNFNANLGADNKLFTSASLSGAAPSNLVFTGSPFTYDPSKGNLLLDIIVSPGGVPANFMGYEASYAFTCADPTLSICSGSALGVYSRYQNFGTVTSAMGWGLVTGFDFTQITTPPPCTDCTPPPCTGSNCQPPPCTDCGPGPGPGEVPEPATLSLAALGLGLVFVVRRRR